MLPRKTSMQDESENMLFNFVLGSCKSFIHVIGRPNFLYMLDNGEFTVQVIAVFWLLILKCTVSYFSHQLNTCMEMEAALWFLNKMFGEKSIPRASHVPADSLTRKEINYHNRDDY